MVTVMVMVMVMVMVIAMVMVGDSDGDGDGDRVEPLFSSWHVCLSMALLTFDSPS